MPFRARFRRSTWIIVCGLVALTGCDWSPDDDGGSSGAGGEAASGGTAGASGTSGAGGAGSAGGAAGSAGSGGAGGNSTLCDQACGENRECCVDHCVNLMNDPHHCGGCGIECKPNMMCSAGQCIEVPCSATCGGGTQCCGNACCGSDELCCDPQGPVSIEPQCTKPNEFGTCPTGCAPLCMCADPDTLIATPEGERPIVSLRAGDLVYSVHRGELRAVSLLRTGRRFVADHHVLRVTLATGRVLEISPGHPTADGRSFADLMEGTTLDGVRIRSVERIVYTEQATYDILPDSDTGAYFAGGVLIGSTLADQPELVTTPSAPFTP